MKQTSTGRKGKKSASAKTVKVRQSSNKSATAPVKPKVTLKKAPPLSLQRWNVWLAVLFGAQAVAILLLGVAHKLPITLQYVAPDPLSDNHLVSASHQLFEINLVQLVAAVLLVAAAAHVLAATLYRRLYEQELGRGISRLRWVEYAVTSGLTLVILALVGGIYDLASLLMILALAVIAQGLHLFISLQPRPREPSWALWRMACAATIVPWLVLGLYIFGTHVFGMSRLPMYVYWLYGSIALLFVGVTLNHDYQFTQHGRWMDYLYGEKVYLGLSLATKAALAWILFAGVLHA